ncbi:MAG: leucine-rich repeat domain-containing protein, partial [Myxococcales bacterium]|nr:leucine-rich repeat domain-containing protein [Myxococcales bacterium]
LAGMVRDVNGRRTLYVPATKRLEAFPVDVCELDTVQVLHLDGHGMGRVDPCISRLGDLVVLSLNWNGLTALPDALGSLQRLEELSLLGNPIATIPDGVLTLPSLKVLDVKSTRLGADEIARIRARRPDLQLVVR